MPDPLSPLEMSTWGLHAIWQLPEVVELIFEQLPMQDLLLSQRTCRNWQTVVQKSPRLQAALFFQPIRNKDADQQIERRGNPLLYQHFRPWFKRDRSQVDKLEEHMGSIARLPWAGSIARLAFLRREASWRRMLVTQPPLHTFELADGHTAFGGSSISVGVLDAPTGLRMGPVYDQTQRATDYSQRFYTVIDGAVTENFIEEQSKAQDKHRDGQRQPGSARSRVRNTGTRIFGGDGKFTLVVHTFHSCDGDDFAHGTTTIPLKSAGAELEDLNWSQVEQPGHDPEGYDWWTDDGWKLEDGDDSHAVSLLFE